MFRNEKDATGGDGIHNRKKWHISRFAGYVVKCRV
jgi:hypothetical protein